MAFAAKVALFKDDLKAILAYSTVSHLGLITFLFGLGTEAAALAAVFHILCHATFKAALFMVAGIVDHEAHTRDIRLLGGLRRVMPVTFVLATIATLSMAGVPLLNGFLSKEMMLEEAAHTAWLGNSWIVPAMATLALAPYHDGPRCHFVSNVDGAHLADTLQGLDPERTLVIVASKTFTTVETMTNAASARRWMAERVTEPGQQFVALSSAVRKAEDFGIAGARVFGFGDWVGGRYSLWGPIGLSLMVAIGPERFEEMLAGAREMDQHFQNAPLEQNLPVLLALVGLWHHQGMGHATRAVIPYDQRLARLPAYLQQLEMESNGKGVAMDGHGLTQAAAPIVWGEPGTNGQHAFFQLIHQGRQVVPVEFLIAAEGNEPDMAEHQALLVANCLAQSQALMLGRNLAVAREIVAGRFAEDAVEMQARHRVFPGNRPSITLAYDRLTPFRLGQIVALYEHRVFVEGVVCGINSFDQWGVELGKELATALQPMVDGTQDTAGQDGSTAGLIAFLRA